MAQKLLATLIFVVALLPGLAGADELTAIIQKDLQTLGYDPGSTDGEATVQTVVAISKFQAENDLEVTGEVTPQLAGVIKATISKQGQAAPVAKAAPTPSPATMDPAAMQALMQAQGGTGAAMDPAAAQAMMQQMGMDPAAMQAMMAQMQAGGAMDPALLQAMQMQAAQAQQAQAAQAQSAQQACLQQKIAAAQQAQEAAKKKRGFGSLMRGLSRLGGDDLASSISSVSADIYETTAGIADLESAAKDLGITESDVEACRNPQ